MSDAQSPLQSIFAKQQAAYLTDMNPSAEKRIERLDRAAQLVFENQEALCQALSDDYNGRHQYLTKMSEVMMSLNHIQDAKKRLRSWMNAEKRKVPFPMGLFGAKAHLHYQPKGVVGIMSPWNFPIGMVFNPLATALAAGNRVIIKPSEFNPKTAELMGELFKKYFPEDEVAMVTGGPEVGAEFSTIPFDHILFTGATSIGRMVMQAAAKNLTPVTLELGGKSPVIISDNYDVKLAAEKIMAGKAMNSGQVCVSPDYIFVPEDKVQDFIEAAKATFQASFPDSSNNQDYTAVINSRHHDRINGMITDAKENGVDIFPLDDSQTSDEGNLRIPIHFAMNPTDDRKLMQEEIFGPIGIIKPYKDMDACITEINKRERPLALYFFSNSKTEHQHVLNNTISGGVTLNNVTMHVACQDLPFGGVGHSGIGNYHGHEGFKTFSHARSVYTDGWLDLAKVAGIAPPYTEKTGKALDSQIKL